MYPGEKTRELPNLSLTRWWARATSCTNLLSRFACVIQLLRVVSAEDKGARATTARGLLSQLNSEFLHLLYFFQNVLTKVNKVSVQIQDTNMDLGEACKLICAVKEELTDMRKIPEHFKNEVNELSAICNINSQERPRRTCSVPPRLEEYVAADSAGRSRSVNPELTEYDDIYIQLLDCLLAELEKRFSTDAQHIMHGISALTPTSADFLSLQHLREISLKFDVNPDELQHEVPLVNKLVSNAKSIKEFLIEIIPYKRAFNAIYRLLLIAVTLPVTSASCERSFSKMKIVKTYLRNSMSNERLTNLALLSIESNRAEQIDLEDFVDEFDARHENRRIKLH